MSSLFFEEYIVFGWYNSPPDFYNLLLLAWWLWASYVIFRSRKIGVGEMMVLLETERLLLRNYKKACK